VALKPLTSQTYNDPVALQKELEKIRQEGYAASFGEWILEASGAAAPIFGPEGVVLGALSISGPSARFTAQLMGEYGAEARRVTRTISQLMGFNLAAVSEYRNIA
jgi:DNA-binding IclR family transcriptional regulator